MSRDVHHPLLHGACAVLIRCAARLVPPGSRDRWREEWLGELWHGLAGRPQKGGWRLRLTMLARSVDAFRDAWLSRAADRRGGAGHPRRFANGIESFWHDLRFAARTFRQQRAYTMLVVTVFAVGIGANATVFSVVHGVLLEPLAYQHPAELVQINAVRHSRFGAFVDRRQRYGDMLRWRDGGGPLKMVSGVIDSGHRNVFYLTGVDEPERLRGALVSANFFTLLGTPPFMGRTFGAGDEEAGNVHVAVLSHSLWRRRFASDPAVVGGTVLLNGTSHTVLGVTPPEFTVADPSGGGGYAAEGVEIWVPLRPEHIRPDPDPASGAVDRVIARLQPGVTLAQAEAELNTRDWDSERRIQLLSLHEEYIGHTRKPLAILSGVVGLVLLLSCVNIAGLSLARLPSRRRELAVRAALGASRGRLVRQVLTESFVFAVVGGIIGLILSVWGKELLTAMAPGNIPRLDQVRISGTVAAFGAGVTALAGVIAAIIPAWTGSRADLQVDLKEGRALAGGGGTHRTRDVLVVVQIALALVLLLGGGLMIRSFWRLNRVEPGIAVDRLLAADVYRRSDDRGRAPGAIAFYRQLTERIASLPGVSGVTLTSSVPFRPRDYYHPEWRRRKVDSQYFDVLAIPVIQGRGFRPTDDRGAPTVAVISESLARSQFPDGNPLGAALDGYIVVGVVADVRHVDLATPPLATMYTHHMQEPDPRMSLIVQTSVPPMSVTAAVRDVVWDLDPDQPVANVASLADILATSDTVSAQRFNVRVLSVLGFVAVVLAMLGIYGVVAQFVTSRTREIGVRMALGSDSTDVVRLVIARGARLAVVGTVIGMLGAMPFARFLQDLLYEMTPTDPVTFCAVAAVLIATTLAASFLPARRAAHVDPVIAFRAE